jgi:hypothetical protein
MPPKAASAKVKATKGSKRTAAASSSAPIVAPPSCLLEEQERAESVDVGKKRKSGAAVDKDYEGYAKKALFDHFKGWPVALTHMKTVGDLTLMKRIKRDRESGETMGKNYWSKRTAEYMDDRHPLKQLQILDEDEELQPELEAAILPMMKKNRDLTVMLDFFQYGRTLQNQRSACGLVKECLKVPTLTPPVNFDFWLAFMKYTADHSMHTVFPSVFGVLMPSFLAVMLKTHETYKGQAMSTKEWWDAYKHLGQLVLPKAAMDACCAVPIGSSWAAVKDSLMEVTRNELGDRCFGFAVRRLHRDKVSSIIAASVRHLNSADITLDTIRTNRDAFVTKCSDEGIQPNCAVAPYEITLYYRRCPLQRTVHSPIDAYGYTIAANTHSLGVETGVLDKFLCEDSFVTAGPAPTIAIEAAALVDSQRARTTATSAIRKKQATTGVAVLEVLNDFNSILQPLDKYWQLEHTFIASHVGEQGDARLSQKMLAALPTKQQPRSIVDVCKDLEALRNSKLFEFCTAGQQEVFKNLQEWVLAIRNDIPPEFAGADDGTAKEVKDRLAYSLSVMTPTTDAAVGTLLHGKDAIKHIHGAVADGMRARIGEMKLKDLTQLQVYSYMLDATQVKALALWTQTLYARAGACVAVPKAKAKAKSGAASSSGSTSAELKSRFASLFKNN